MLEIDAFEAERKLSALLDQVEQGAEISITRRGRAVAKLVPASTSSDCESARRAADNLLARSHGVALDGLKIRDLVDEGRR